MAQITRNRWKAIFWSSFAFGLTRWTREKDLLDAIIYVGLTSLTGVVYALAYAITGNVMCSASLHLVVETVQKFFLKVPSTIS